MGKKTADDPAVRDLEEALHDLVEAAQRRAEAAFDSPAQRQAMSDMRRAIERLRRWRRPSRAGAVRS